MAQEWRGAAGPTTHALAVNVSITNILPNLAHAFKSVDSCLGMDTVT